MNEYFRTLRPLFRGFPIIIISVLVSILIAKKYLNYQTPIYESTAKLKLADIQEGISSSNLFKDLDVFASAYKIATEIEVLKSDELIQKTIKDLPFDVEIYRKGEIRTIELFNDSPISVEGTFKSNQYKNIKIGMSIDSRKTFTLYFPNLIIKKGVFGKPIKLSDGQILITLNQKKLNSKKIKLIDNYEIEFLSEQKIIEKLNKNLDIVPIDKDVPVIRINLKSNIPEKAALFVNKLAETYIQDYIENKYKAANITAAFLNKEINRANQRLIKSENDIQNYRENNNIINILQETETDLSKVSQLKIQQTNIKIELTAIKYLNQYISEGKNNFFELAPNFETFTDILSTEIVKNIKKLQSDKKELLLIYTPDHEKIKIIDSDIKDLVNYQIESIKNTEKNLQIKYNELSNDINTAEKAFINLPEKEKILTILKREFNLFEKNYNFLNEKRIEAEIAKSAKIAFHKLITSGEVSKTPVSPIRIIIIIVSIFIGIFSSTTLIFLVHLAKAKVNDHSTIEKNSTIPIALVTPFLKSQHEKDINFLKEAMQLELKGILQYKNKITITSYDKSREHLYHSKNLIEAIQKQGRTVLVIDATGNLENHIDPSNYINYSDLKYLYYTKADFEKEINDRMIHFDLCLIHNQAIKEEKLSLVLMSMATHNLIVADTRKTAEKSILKIELLNDEYKLPNLWFIVNRNGYNPSVFLEFKKIIFLCVNKIIFKNEKNKYNFT
jgi:uncharacterized protein involved in exopolysaccharide biosynthesis